MTVGGEMTPREEGEGTGFVPTRVTSDILKTHGIMGGQPLEKAKALQVHYETKTNNIVIKRMSV